MLKDLLTNQMPKQFGKTPLEDFGAKLQQGRFTDQSTELRDCQNLLSLVEQRDRVLQQLKAIEAEEARAESDEDNSTNVMNTLFKTEHSKIYLEDLGQIRPEQQSSSEDSGYDDEMMDSEEFAVYNEIHEEEDQIKRVEWT